LVGTLSLASDAGQGMPDDAAIRAAVLAAGLAEVAGADEATAADAYLLPVLRYAGCTADANLTASVMGDKAAVQRDMYGIDYAEPSELLPFMLRRIGRDQPLPRRILEVFTAFRGFPKLLDTGTAHCEVGDRIAACFGIEQRTRGTTGLFCWHACQRRLLVWDASGPARHGCGMQLRSFWDDASCPGGSSSSDGCTADSDCQRCERCERSTGTCLTELSCD
jgi:hypothetical protein